MGYVDRHIALDFIERRSSARARHTVPMIPCLRPVQKERSRGESLEAEKQAVVRALNDCPFEPAHE